MIIDRLRRANTISGRAATLSACVLALLLDAAQAQAPMRPTQSQTVQARSVDLPLGQVIGPPRAIREAPRPRVPMGYDALEEIKRRPGPPRTGAITPPAPLPRAPLTNCQTNSSNGGFPPDIHGAAGPTNIIAVTNEDIGVYNKTTCAVVGGMSLLTLFNAGTGEDYYDPQVLWDDTNQRFVVTAESRFQGNTNQNQGLAVSKDSSGTSWWVYVIHIINGNNIFCVPDNGTNWDYPHVGSLNGANPRWFIVANDFPSAGGVIGALISITKTPTLSGGTINGHCFGPLQDNTAPPNVKDASNVAYFLSTSSGSGNSIVRYAYSSSSNINNDTMTTTNPISITAWTAPPGAQQPNGVALDTSDGRFVSQTIQNGTSLWNVHSVNVANTAAGRLYQFSTTGTSPLFTLDLVTDPNDNIFNLSVATNATQAFVSASRTIPPNPANGKAAMVIFKGPSSSATGWTFDLVATSTSQYTGPCSRSACRWGDNSATQIDPSNSANAWAFNQLITGPNESNWTTLGALEGGGGGTSPAVMTSPTPGSTLSSTSATFQWTTGTGVTSYWLYVGTNGVGSNDIFNQQESGTSQMVNGLPSNGQTVYVRLYSQISGSWQRNDYTYTACSSCGPQPAAITSPTQGTALPDTTVQFQWNAGTGVSQYWLYVGTGGVGSSDLYNSSTGTTQNATVGNLPSSGQTVYVRLYSLLPSGWAHNDYTYRSCTGCGAAAVMTNPAPGTTLASTSQAFTWSPGTGVSQYYLQVGTYGLGNSNLYSATATSPTTVTGLPGNGNTLYVRLWSKLAGGWVYNDYAYEAVTSGSGGTMARLTSPTAGSQLAGTTQTFTWSAGGSGVTGYWFTVGTNGLGSGNVFAQSVSGGSQQVTGLPSNGTVFVRLWSSYSGDWWANDYTFTAAGGPVPPPPSAAAAKGATALK